MKEVDYAKLSEQYAGFLKAAGGVSITVLTLLLGLRSQTPPPPGRRTEAARLFLVAALIVAIVSCFAGAHMMAETSAFFARLNEKLPSKRPHRKILLGQRLFVLATAHIFIAIGLIIFATVLLPTASGQFPLATAIQPISHVVFIGVLVGALVWMGLAAADRTPRWPRKGLVITSAIATGLVGGFACCWLSIESLPRVIFIVIVSLAAISLIYFGVTFKGVTCKFLRIQSPNFWLVVEVGVFGFAITFSYASLVVSYFRIMALSIQ